MVSQDKKIAHVEFNDSIYLVKEDICLELRKKSRENLELSLHIKEKDDWVLKDSCGILLFVNTSTEEQFFVLNEISAVFEKSWNLEFAAKKVIGQRDMQKMSQAS